MSKRKYEYTVTLRPDEYVAYAEDVIATHKVKREQAKEKYIRMGFTVDDDGTEKIAGELEQSKSWSFVPGDEMRLILESKVNCEDRILEIVETSRLIRFT